MITAVAQEKRRQFQAFIEQLLAPEEAVVGVVGIGSLATGLMRPESDIDAVIFLHPYDLYIVPAEAIWVAEDDTFYSIFDDRYQEKGLSVDFARLPLSQWADPDFAWPEGYRAELRNGWLAYDPTGQIAQLIARKTAYDEETRLRRLDEALIWLDQHLGERTPQQVWQALGPAIAFDRLQAAYDYLVAALFAYNRQWRIWRNREMGALLNLAWLPSHFADRVLLAANAPSLDFSGYLTRVEALQSLFADLREQLIANGDYAQMPIDQAFLRLNEEPGRAWNLEEWNKFRIARKL
jgi:predicted nucleotidyltransferase